MGNYRLKKHATTTNLCWILKKLRSNEPYQNSAIVLFKQLKKTLVCIFTKPWRLTISLSDIQIHSSKACEIIKEDTHYCHYVYVFFVTMLKRKYFYSFWTILRNTMYLCEKCIAAYILLGKIALKLWF